jgi:D-glycero-D-manno-heptose 1,7-bisphosphate phosphatase
MRMAARQSHSLAPLRRAVFLDLDGMLLEHAPYAFGPQRVVLARGAAGALRALESNGFRSIVVSNQPGVALGRLAPEALALVENRIRELLAASGAELDAFYYCPHFPRAANVRYAVRCLCRKPQPGLLRRAARERQIDLAQSWLVGDALDDVEAGNRAGCRTVLVDNGREAEWRLGAHREPTCRAPSLPQAVQRILAAAGRGPQHPAGEQPAARASR